MSDKSPYEFHFCVLVSGAAHDFKNQQTLLEMFSFLSCMMKISLHHAFEYSIAKGRRQKREKRWKIVMLLVTREEI